MPNSTWKHPDLGTFKRRTEYGYTEWVGVADIPDFAVFRFRGTRPFRGTKRVPIAFASNANDFTPSAKMARLATKVVANGQKLAVRIKRAFFQDLLGTGPDSGMWWHDDEVTR
ncbi:hypothetical protein SH528x_003166 [Novipirellula sp. SH528]|uniref:hypothetical protein n=1 Tax=Novipirellula sp. SH528 TaxID=3454466 RepID=UPI003F9F9318